MGPLAGGALWVCWVWREEGGWSPWQEGSGKLVGVEVVSGSQVACDEPAGCFGVDDLLVGLGQHDSDCSMSLVWEFPSFDRGVSALPEIVLGGLGQVSGGPVAAAARGLWFAGVQSSGAGPR